MWMKCHKFGQHTISKVGLAVSQLRCKDPFSNLMKGLKDDRQKDGRCHFDKLCVRKTCSAWNEVRMILYVALPTTNPSCIF